MKRYFIYELKKNFWPLVILTAISAGLYLVTLSYFNPVSRYAEDSVVINTPPLSTVMIELCILCIVAPILMYSFKMNKRSVDAFYSLPIKREKIYLVKTLVGLLLVLIPYTLSYWLGFLSVVVRENHYHLVYFVSGYFLSVFLAVCLYGVNAFAFSRANRIVDGIVFMVFYTFILCLFVGLLSGFFPKLNDKVNAGDYIIYSILFGWADDISRLIAGKEIYNSLITPTKILVPALSGAVCYALLFSLVRFEKSEDSEQNSDSWFGYKTMIPAYTVLMTALWGGDLLSYALIIVGAIILSIVYTRKFLFGWKQWLTIAVAFAVGLGCYFLIDYIRGLPTDPPQYPEYGMPGYGSVDDFTEVVSSSLCR